MTWIIVAALSYFFTASANTIDKIMVSKYIPKAYVYAFYVGILGMVSIVVIPFDIYIPPILLLLVHFIAGAGFVVGLYLMYSALLKGETTRVIPIIGVVVPLITFILAYFFLGERLAGAQLIAFVFLILGVLIITYHKSENKIKKYTFAYYAFFAGIAFAITYTITKYLYDLQPEHFLSAFFWMRVGAFIAAIVILLMPHARAEIVADYKKPKAKRGSLLFVGQILGAAGFVLLNLAISLSSVTLVNAMQGLQYVFVFIFIVILARWIPTLQERMTMGVVIQKVVAIIVIGIGLAFLAQ